MSRASLVSRYSAELPSSELVRTKNAILRGATWAALFGIACSGRSASTGDNGELAETGGGAATGATPGASTGSSPSLVSEPGSSTPTGTGTGGTVTGATSTGNTVPTGSTTTGTVLIERDAGGPTGIGTPVEIIDASTPVGGAASLPEVPVPDGGISCRGEEFSGGYFGRCCQDTFCVQPPPDGICPSPAEASGPYGSGQCECTQEGEERGGPFADPSGGGACCYTTWAIGCTGRPIRVAGHARIAPLVTRADWC